MRELGERLDGGLRELPGVGDVRGRGLMLAIEIEGAPDVVRRALFEQRLVLNATGPTTVRLLPPLIVGEAEVDERLSRLRALLSRPARRERQICFHAKATIGVSIAHNPVVLPDYSTSNRPDAAIAARFGLDRAAQRAAMCSLSRWRQPCPRSTHRLGSGGRAFVAWQRTSRRKTLVGDDDRASLSRSVRLFSRR